VTEHFDVVVLGAGSGLTAAYYADKDGKSVAVIDSQPGALGGTCVNVGCIPTKGLVQAAEVYQTVRDAAKFGQLLLTDGTWNGERIVSSEWLAESVTPRTAIGWPDPAQWDWQMTGYGYQWWAGFYDGDGVRVESIVAWGYGGQWVIVLPSLDVVVVINSNGFDGGDAALNQAHALVVNHILPALR